MKTLTDQISTIGKGNADAAQKLANLSINAALQLTQLQMDAAKTFLTTQSASAQKLMSAHDPKGASLMSQKSAENATQGALDYSRHVYEIVSHTQHEIAAVMEERFNVMREQMQAAMGEWLKQAPGGSDPAVNAIKAAFVSSQNAFDALNKAARQGANATANRAKS